MTAPGRSLKIGLTQWHATTDVAANTAVALRVIERAAADGARIVVLPENGLMLGSNVAMREAAFDADSPTIAALRDAAARLGVVLVVGGLKNSTPDGVFNSALVIDRSGQIVGRYDKIHLFDANIGGQSFEASSVERAGAAPTLLDVDGVRIGMLICYDVRFPELSRELAAAGAEVLLVPSAFVQSTGEAHWHTLLRARAIENLAYVIAPATVGSSTPDVVDAFPTYGHALAVSPWGEVLADLGTETEAVQTVDLDLDRVGAARSKLPVLAGRREHAVYATEPTVITVGATEPREGTDD
ncbi:nitrilase-related carbon-nitrogen hydrolase [Gordonia neofelifaecis]|uniref:Carbon-nitrogen family hydrolase n=1 Tax=Gordonia neofelifaecis NRRL B-59395 TaxID=644548 RepID=F1YHS5_9ACTN|nr:nitrilase-related carbon-nitrogen hydrolase [Gordonia neofelifaecis]EGD55913.1 carbon-nitrogen family hydrolase [Gordonia neofelifaecis NRRL B-59395]